MSLGSLWGGEGGARALESRRGGRGAGGQGEVPRAEAKEEYDLDFFLSSRSFRPPTGVFLVWGVRSVNSRERGKVGQVKEITYKFQIGNKLKKTHFEWM